MPHYLIADRSVITERRAAGGWRAVVVGTAVYADGDTEADALAALAALFTEPRDVTPQDTDYSPAPWQV